jgi:hypothetical protein
VREYDHCFSALTDERLIDVNHLLDGAGSGSFVARITFDGIHTFYHFTWIDGRLYTSRNATPFSNMQTVTGRKTIVAIVDTLSLIKNMYLPNRFTIADTSLDLGDLKLYPMFSGTATTFKSFDQYSFQVDGYNCLVVVPEKVAAGNPWIWRSYFFTHKPYIDSILCARGYYLAFMDAPNLYGAPTAITRFNAFYAHLTSTFGFSAKPVLIGISRGGLYVYNWALTNLDRVSCIYGDGVVMDFVSWPCHCYGIGSGSESEWTALKAVYGFTSDAQAKAYKGNPYQNMKPFALAKIPMINVYGEIDTVVPAVQNVLPSNDSLKIYGWQMKLLPKPNTGHTHGVTSADGGLPSQLDTLLNFITRNTKL